MLDQRSSSERRDSDNRRHRMNNRRIRIVPVNSDRRARFDRRDGQDRRVYIDRRTAAATFLDIA